MDDNTTRLDRLLSRIQLLNPPYRGSEEGKQLFQEICKLVLEEELIRFKNGTMLVLETKGQESDQDKTKREFLEEWVKAVNEHGEFGIWRSALSRSPGDVAEILYRPDKPSPG